MNRRRAADRAEAIVKGIGVIVLLLLLFGLTKVLPPMLKGKESGEMMITLMHVLAGFAVLGGLVGVVALIVRVKVMKGKRKQGGRRTLRAQAGDNQRFLSS